MPTASTDAVFSPTGYGFKIRFLQGSGGSSPPLGTSTESAQAPRIAWKRRFGAFCVSGARLPQLHRVALNWHAVGYLWATGSKQALEKGLTAGCNNRTFGTLPFGNRSFPVSGVYVTPGGRACLQCPYGTPYRCTLPLQLEHALPNTPFPLMHSPNGHGNEVAATSNAPRAEGEPSACRASVCALVRERRAVGPWGRLWRSRCYTSTPRSFSVAIARSCAS